MELPPAQDSCVFLNNSSAWGSIPGKRLAFQRRLVHYNLPTFLFSLSGQDKLTNIYTSAILLASNTTGRIY